MSVVTHRALFSRSYAHCLKSVAQVALGALPRQYAILTTGKVNIAPGAWFKRVGPKLPN